MQSDKQLVRTVVYIQQSPQENGNESNSQEWKFSSFENYSLRDLGKIMAGEFFKDEDLLNSIMSLHYEK